MDEVRGNEDHRNANPDEVGPRALGALDHEPQLQHWAERFCDVRRRGRGHRPRTRPVLAWRCDGDRPLKMKVKLEEKGFGTRVAIAAKGGVGSSRTLSKRFSRSWPSPSGARSAPSSSAGAPAPAPPGAILDGLNASEVPDGGQVYADAHRGALARIAEPLARRARRRRFRLYRRVMSPRPGDAHPRRRLRARGPGRLRAGRRDHRARPGRPARLPGLDASSAATLASFPSSRARSRSPTPTRSSSISIPATAGASPTSYAGSPAATGCRRRTATSRSSPMR